MDIESFLEAYKRAKHLRPAVFEMSDMEAPATEAQIDSAERSLGVRLPLSYRALLQKVGSGQIGFSLIFSVDPASEWNIVEKQSELKHLFGDDFLVVSTDFAGGLYLLKVVSGCAGEQVYSWTLERGPQETMFEDVLSFLGRYALEPA